MLNTVKGPEKKILPQKRFECLMFALSIFSTEYSFPLGKRVVMPSSDLNAQKMSYIEIYVLLERMKNATDVCLKTEVFCC